MRYGCSTAVSIARSKEDYDIVRAEAVLNIFRQAAAEGNLVVGRVNHEFVKHWTLEGDEYFQVFSSAEAVQINEYDYLDEEYTLTTADIEAWDKLCMTNPGIHDLIRSKMMVSWSWGRTMNRLIGPDPEHKHNEAEND